LLEKSKLLPLDIHWHFIGSIQSNKLKQLAEIPNIYVLESLDGIKKAILLNKQCQQRPDKLRVFIQVNTSGEECTV
jgi:uncharacterized pyridoxal phosphate-containing UPF0001 family protein